MGIYLVMKNNLKRSMKHRVLFVVIFLLPVILCALFGLIRFDKISLRIGILESQEEADREDQEVLYRLLEQSDGIAYAMADEENSNTDLMMGKFHMILEYHNTAAGEVMHIHSYQSEKRQQQLQAAVEKMIKEKMPLSLVGYKEPGLSTTERSVTMILTLFMVFATIHAATFIRDRDSGLMVRYQYSGYHHLEYLLGYFFHTLLLTFMQILLCILSLSLLQPGFSLSLTDGLLIASAIAAMSSTYGVAICSLSKSEVSANIIASSMAGIFAILGGTFVAVEAMPGVLRGLSFASPVRWLVELLQII